MPSTGKGAAKKKLREAVRSLERSLTEVAAGSKEAREQAEKAFREALWQAWTVAEDYKVEEDVPEPEPVDFGDVIAHNLRWWRTEMADWTQAMLAEAVNYFGFSWSRTTVAEIENGTRKVSLEELLVLASLYSVPLVQLLMLDLGQNFKMPDGRVIDGGTVNELLAGKEFTWQWDQEWYASAYVAQSAPHEMDWRPAKSVANRLWSDDLESRRRRQDLERRVVANMERRPRDHVALEGEFPLRYVSRPPGTARRRMAEIEEKTTTEEKKGK